MKQVQLEHWWCVHPVAILRICWRLVSRFNSKKCQCVCQWESSFWPAVRHSKWIHKNVDYRKDKELMANMSHSVSSHLSSSFHHNKQHSTTPHGHMWRMSKIPSYLLWSALKLLERIEQRRMLHNLMNLKNNPAHPQHNLELKQRSLFSKWVSKCFQLC